ncbi:hypothetical protein AAG570_004545 [Ranatra chinensis]|uniref:HTH La-type RNA-binding domain-containing protein n=1 Tax=Ranatra chinensis TaxID=642074 RepID=A0ABD0Y1G9_9HEMI
MNGDVAKLPSGAVYAATPESHAPSPTADFSIINGIGDPTDSVVSEAQPPPPPPPPLHSDPNGPSMPIDQLKQMLSSQLEYYFSRENLANDAYLISQMDNDQYVPIWTVANFNQVKKLTTDIKLITEVLRESPNVQVDEEGQKVRPNHKRCIVILREIPDSTPLEEVKALFSGKGCPKLISCEFAHNNSWYVTFENDEDAQRAYRFLREEVKEFQGKPIMARIKAKPMNRLPMPTVGPGMGGMKNGYRTPPATAATAAAAAATATVYDPAAAAFPPGQQRFLYNGTSLPPNVNYTNQTFQQHQPFYPPSMLPHWGATTPAYFDIGSVFSVNGLAPQGTFSKSHNTRFMPRNRNKRSSGLEQRTSLSDSSLVRGSSHSNTGGPKTSSGGGGGKSMYYSDRGSSREAQPPVTTVPQAQEPSSCSGGAGPGPEVGASLQQPLAPTCAPSARPQPPTTTSASDQDDPYRTTATPGASVSASAASAQPPSAAVTTKDSLPPR